MKEAIVDAFSSGKHGDTGLPFGHHHRTNNGHNNGNGGETIPIIRTGTINLKFPTFDSVDLDGWIFQADQYC